MKKTICFDFDGVIHSYKSGWMGIENIPDMPVEGIGEVIERLRKKYLIWCKTVYNLTYFALN